MDFTATDSMYLEQLERRLAATAAGPRGSHRRAARVLERLAPRERAAFLLTESGGLTARGVAAVLDVPLRRARRLVADAEERVMLDPRVLGLTTRCSTATLLPVYVSGRLSPVGRIVVRSHLRTCPGCRSGLAAYGDVRAVARALVIEQRPRVFLAPATRHAPAA
jgi:hypothetical protein